MNNCRRARHVNFCTTNRRHTCPDTSFHHGVWITDELLTTTFHRFFSFYGGKHNTATANKDTVLEQPHIYSCSIPSTTYTTSTNRFAGRTPSGGSRHHITETPNPEYPRNKSSKTLKPRGAGFSTIFLEAWDEICRQLAYGQRPRAKRKASRHELVPSLISQESSSGRVIRGQITPHTNDGPFRIFNREGQQYSEGLVTPQMIITRNHFQDSPTLHRRHLAYNRLWKSKSILNDHLINQPEKRDLKEEEIKLRQVIDEECQKTIEALELVFGEGSHMSEDQAVSIDTLQLLGDGNSPTSQDHEVLEGSKPQPGDVFAASDESRSQEKLVAKFDIAPTTADTTDLPQSLHRLLVEANDINQVNNQVTVNQDDVPTENVPQTAQEALSLAKFVLKAADLKPISTVYHVGAPTRLNMNTNLLHLQWHTFAKNNLNSLIHMDASLDMIMKNYCLARIMFSRATPVLSYDAFERLLLRMLRQHHFELCEWLIHGEDIDDRLSETLSKAGVVPNNSDDLTVQASISLDTLLRTEDQYSNYTFKTSTLSDYVTLSLCDLPIVLQTINNPQTIINLWKQLKEHIAASEDSSQLSLKLMSNFVARAAELELGGQTAWGKLKMPPLLTMCVDIVDTIMHSSSDVSRVWLLFQPLQAILRIWLYQYWDKHSTPLQQLRDSSEGSTSPSMFEEQPFHKPNITIQDDFSEGHFIPHMLPFLRLLPKDFADLLLEATIMKIPGPAINYGNHQRLGTSAAYGEPTLPKHILQSLVGMADELDLQHPPMLVSTPTHQRGLRRALEDIVGLRGGKMSAQYLLGKDDFYILRFICNSWVRDGAWTTLTTEMKQSTLEQELNKNMFDIMKRSMNNGTSIGLFSDALTHINSLSLSQKCKDYFMEKIVTILFRHGRDKDVFALVQAHQARTKAPIPVVVLDEMIGAYPENMRPLINVLHAHRHGSSRMDKLRHYTVIIQKSILENPRLAMKAYRSFTSKHIGGIPSHTLLVSMARGFANTQHLTPKQAMHWTHFCWKEFNKHGFRPDIRIAEALAWVYVVRGGVMATRKRRSFEITFLYEYGTKTLQRHAFLADRMREHEMWLAGKDVRTGEVVENALRARALQEKMEGILLKYRQSLFPVRVAW